jgi:hypothetical protein
VLQRIGVSTAPMAPSASWPMWYWGSTGVIARAPFGSMSTGSHKPPQTTAAG